MSDYFFWRKIKKSDIARVEKLLQNAENDYVNACAKFITRKENNTLIWALCGKNDEISALIINSKNNILPVFCGQKKPVLDLKKTILSSKKIHSVQGLKNEAFILENEMNNNGLEPKDKIDYDLMSLDTLPKRGKNSDSVSNLVFRVPNMADIDAIAPLQAAYEKEEVLPKGSTFSPAASRINLAGIIAKGQILAAEIDGQFVGKINVSAVSFTRYQVGGVYVHPEFRGKGIAGRIAYEFISSLVSQGRGVTLFVKKTNIAACRLYSSLGFKKINDYCILYY